MAVFYLSQHIEDQTNILLKIVSFCMKAPLGYKTRIVTNYLGLFHTN